MDTENLVYVCPHIVYLVFITLSHSHENVVRLSEKFIHISVWKKDFVSAPAA